MSYRWLEHTSELELQIDAASERSVFETAAAAFAELAEEREEGAGGGSAGGGSADGRALALEIAVAAGDRAAMLAAFLEELVYLLETEDLVPERLERVELGDDRLSAIVRGHRGAPRHLVKGVTYNELTFQRHGERFTATVVLDV